MHYRSIFLLLSCISLFAVKLQAQTDTLHINNTTFIAKTNHTAIGEYGKRDTILTFYRMEKGKPKQLLQHTLYNYGADCNNEFITKGSYTVQHDSIIFTSTIKQKTGLDPIADEERQIYRVEADGKLKLISNKQHINNQWKEISTK